MKPDFKKSFETIACDGAIDSRDCQRLDEYLALRLTFNDEKDYYSQNEDARETLNQDYKDELKAA